MRTRDAIVDATISLVEEGDLRPTAPRVAERAGVSVRSVFQHFDDLEGLHASVAERVVERVARVLVPVSATLTIEERLDAFVRQRCRLLEVITPMRRAAEVHGPFSVEVTARMRDARAFLRQEVVVTFGPELDAAGADFEDLLDSLDAVLSWTTWDSLRTGMGRDPAMAERLMRRLAAAVLGERRTA